METRYRLGHLKIFQSYPFGKNTRNILVDYFNGSGGTEHMKLRGPSGLVLKNIYYDKCGLKM